ncbi:MAG: DUF3427 domain-containing protein [Bacilli bacterium]|jgi:superfamily II DNA or RNA helicase|nr:DUF3427 domain-containing protein [Bacilli bacterium]
MFDKGFYTNASDITFLDKAIADLDACDSFDWTVSFIKKAGLALLYPAIEKALKRGARGRIVTSTYQNFTDVPALEMFLTLQDRYKNFECHLDYGCFGDDGFHTKGYVFAINGRHEIIIGSSNITYWALRKNKEWDLSVFSDENDVLLKEVETEFDGYWKATYALDRDIVKRYAVRLAYAIESWDMDYFDPTSDRPVRPNLMQRSALKEIARYRREGVDKALVVAATGSGKTYLAAFDALNFQAKKLLFVVHKDIILEEALQTFAKVFGRERTYGVYTDEQKRLDTDFVFASNQILAKHLDLFAQDEFDYIVIDEVHHAAASTYRKIIDYFKPQFLLGLTATPDRMDEQSVYDLFDRNVPYDLRLREALENDLVVPFHYYGIKDSLLDYDDTDSQEGIRRIVMSCASQENCQFIANEIEKHRPKGKLRCVAFCRNVEQCRLMKEGMEELGYDCCYLTGTNTTGERIKAFDDLQDEGSPLSIIFCVDILNEGVDVPSMNMVLFLRPTESSTIFIQQLGRGLRKYQGKPYLTVLDFIGNSYTRSVQIAIALGSLSKGGSPDKRAMIDYVRSDFDNIGIPGLEIHIDKESVSEILHSIERTNFNHINLLIQDYKNFKAYLSLKAGEYPRHVDFLNPEVNADLLRYTKKSGSYYDFLVKAGEDVPYFSEGEIDVIRTVSWYLPLIRPYEYRILESLLDGPKTKDELKALFADYENHNDESFIHALKMLMGEVTLTKNNWYVPLVKETDGIYKANFDISSKTLTDWLRDLLSYGLQRFESEFYGIKGPLRIYGPYTMATSLQAINNHSLYNMTGVTYAKGRLLLYINLNKDFQSEERLKYKDKFLSPKVLQWESQTGTTLANFKGHKLMGFGEADIFVRKTKKDDGIENPFVYLGKGKLTNPRDSGNPARALLFDIVLTQPVPEEFKYDFGIEDTDEKTN